MTPDYPAFWAAFKATTAWAGLMAMARYSPEVELRVVRLRVEFADAVAGIPNTADIQEAIWRLMEMVGGQTVPEQVGELAAVMAAHGLSAIYSLQPPETP